MLKLTIDTIWTLFLFAIVVALFFGYRPEPYQFELVVAGALMQIMFLIKDKD